ncbi:MAG: hypothetical protein NTU98_04365 [Bacteroidetes bacterium]|nr:hypothetical protein [Bacteroidota bacterium]
MVIFTIIGVLIVIAVLGSFILGMAGVPIAQSFKTQNTFEAKKEELLNRFKELYGKFITQEEIDFNDALILAQTSYAMVINERLNKDPNFLIPSVRRGADIINQNYDDICEMYGNVNFKEFHHLAEAMIQYSLSTMELIV